MQNPAAALPPFQALYFRVKMKLHTVHGRIFRQGDVQAEGTDNARRGRIESRIGLLRQVRLHLQQFVVVNDTKIRDAVRLSPVVECLKARHVFLGETDHQGTDAPERDIQIFCQIAHQRIAAHVELCHQTAGRGVIAGVDDGAVGLGGAAADILLLFQDADAGRAAGQLPGGGCAGDARAYYDYIVHRYSFLFCAYFRTYRYLQ